MGRSGRLWRATDPEQHQRDWVGQEAHDERPRVAVSLGPASQRRQRQGHEEQRHRHGARADLHQEGEGRQGGKPGRHGGADLALAVEHERDAEDHEDALEKLRQSHGRVCELSDRERRERAGDEPERPAQPACHQSERGDVSAAQDERRGDGGPLVVALGPRQEPERPPSEGEARAEVAPLVRRHVQRDLPEGVEVGHGDTGFIRPGEGRHDDGDEQRRGAVSAPHRSRLGVNVSTATAGAPLQTWVPARRKRRLTCGGSGLRCGGSVQASTTNSERRVPTRLHSRGDAGTRPVRWRV